MKTLGFLTVPLFLMTLLGCQKTSETDRANRDVQGESKEAVQAINKALKTQKDEYKKKAEADLDRLDDTIKNYTEKFNKAEDDVKEKLKLQLDQLQRQRDHIRNKLKDLQGDTQDAWIEFKNGLDKAFSELKEGIEKGKDQFK